MIRQLSSYDLRIRELINTKKLLKLRKAKRTKINGTNRPRLG